MNNSDTYAVVAVTEYYGPETRRSIVSIHEIREEADEAATARPDYNSMVGCAELGHNQASETGLVVMDAVPVDISDPWGLLTGDEEDLAIELAQDALGEDFDPDDVPLEYAEEAMAEKGRFVLQDPDQPGYYWLCEEISE